MPSVRPGHATEVGFAATSHLSERIRRMIHNLISGAVGSPTKLG